jgi:hypothetical protein
VVIGRSGRLVTPEEAQDMIAGYTVLNDLGSIDVSAMAIEDAVVLGEEVAAGGTVQETLQRFMTDGSSGFSSSSRPAWSSVA